MQRRVRRSASAGSALARLHVELRAAEAELRRIDMELALVSCPDLEAKRATLGARFDDLWEIREAHAAPRGTCGKVIYASERIAELARGLTPDRAPDQDFYCYRCVLCEGWHCGHRRYVKQAYGRLAHVVRP